jgi:hypothetical protein
METDFIFFDLKQTKISPEARDRGTDLRAGYLLDAMADGDAFVRSACEQVMAFPMIELKGLKMRQEVMVCALGHQDFFEGAYAICRSALTETETLREYLHPRFDRIVPTPVKVINAIKMAEILIGKMEALQALMAGVWEALGSPSLKTALNPVGKQYALPELAAVRDRLDALSSLVRGGGVVLSARMGRGLKAVDCVLNRVIPNKGEKSKSLTARMMGAVSAEGKCVRIELDQLILVNNASELTHAALLPVLRTVGRYVDGLLKTFEPMQFRFAFFLGCIRLYRRLEALGLPVCFPQLEGSHRLYEASGLYDPSLALNEAKKPTGNAVRLEGRRLWVVTGPNQGGKTTFLRSVGLAQWMAQCGMFVPALSMRSGVYAGILTHFPLAEDISMKNGLLEAELKKLDETVSKLRPGAMILMNEAFSTTVPNEASRIAREVTDALRETGVTVLFVTHLYSFARELYDQAPEDTVFFKAQRDQDGSRSFLITEGEPEITSYGDDIFDEVMGA